MYFIIVWDVDLAATSQDGCLTKFEIPMDFAEFLFRLDSKQFPILSSLSFDDYDLFSAGQIKLLVYELLGVAVMYQETVEYINSMVKVVYDAKSLGKSILFDPFRIV